MTRNQFREAARTIARKRNWTLDLVEGDRSIEAWFSEPHALDVPGRPYGADTAQAYMRNGDAPVGLSL